MKVATCSIVCGSQACNARCPFCISKMTAGCGVEPHASKINMHNFGIFKKAAAHMQASTFLLTGRGEPTLSPDHITQYLRSLSDSPVPFRELQTNGIRLMEDDLNDAMITWHRYGLNTICISAVHYKREYNQKIYSKNYPDLAELTEKLHSIGFTIRLSIMMLNGYISTEDDVVELIGYCKEHKIDQLTIRPITSPEHPENDEIAEWTHNHVPRTKDVELIKSGLETWGSRILALPHGGMVYDYDGQNVCYATCITTSMDTEDIRQLIFYPEGRISHDWKYTGAVLI
jgi:molybdenum cofactor biosynthesis enzyme MoaA